MTALNLTFPRLLVIIALVGTGLILQNSVLAALDLPGATPDLLLVIVLALAMAGGPLTGVVIGFAAGVLLDLAPPASSSLGQTAAIYAIAAFIAGHIELSPGRPEVMTMLGLAAISGGVVIAQALLGTLLGTAHVAISELIFLTVTQVIYALILSLVILPLVGLLYRGAVDDGRRFA